MVEIVKASSASELLAIAPELLGQIPRNSAALLLFSGKRSCAGLPIDLPPENEDAAAAQIVDLLITSAVDIPGVDGVALIIYTDAVLTGAKHLPFENLVDLIHDLASDAVLSVKESLCQASDGWASYFGGWGPSSAPQPLPAIVAPSDSAVPIFDRPPSVSEARRKRVQRCLDGIHDMSHNPATFTNVPRSVAPLNNLPHLVESALNTDPASLHDNTIALLIWASLGGTMRDTLMIQFPFGPEAGWAEFNAPGSARWGGHHSGGWGTTGPAAAAAAERTWHMYTARILGQGDAPSRERLVRAARLLMYIDACASPPFAAGICCILAWIAWALGLVSRADALLQRAQESDPRCPLIEIIAVLLDDTPLPHWVRSHAVMSSP